MVKKDMFEPLISLSHRANSVATLDLLLQGGGARGAATCGFLFEALRYTNLRFDGICGTSAGGLAGAVVADGLSREAQGLQDRQTTRQNVAALFDHVVDYSPYRFIKHLQVGTADLIDHQQKLIYAPHRGQEAWLDYMGKAVRNINEQFSICQHMVTCSLAHLRGEHILAQILARTIHDTTAINHVTAPLYVINVVENDKNDHLLFHNRDGKMITAAHIAATGALSAYLPAVYIPGLGYCRDGAEGGANPPIKEFFALKNDLRRREATPNYGTRHALLYNLSSGDEGDRNDELAARAPKLHAPFKNIIKKQGQDIAAVHKRGEVDLHVIRGALTSEQRRHGLDDTEADHMRGMFEAGRQQAATVIPELLEHIMTAPQHSPRRYDRSSKQPTHQSMRI